MPNFPGQYGRRNGDHRALGMGQAVAAHLATDHPGQRTTTASTHDQQVPGAVGQGDQDPASLTPVHERVDRRISGDFSPDCDERIPEPLTGVLPPDAAQVAAGMPPFDQITFRGEPGENGYQGGIVGAGQFLCVPQCPEAAR
jgi:hypothetical protein